MDLRGCGFGALSESSRVPCKSGNMILKLAIDGSIALESKQIPCHGFNRPLLSLVKNTKNDLDDCFKTSIIFD
ncbi:hypothetical protein Mettu_2224 [Methylobacter tundripaludum SV96]|uniref:Uncharacterized protein n=1 Tax=Methylobacter tundripaludum (strain ATCC BAA-1195 / DSM 17260 / SV96) TaxID=697282 RepID=G3IXG6_METTV|nr:hypothetical protein Mettu_2224 [Methylobacter tundripaludum SV96]